MENSKVVVITGASSGIGEATALRMAKNGAKLVLGARREDRLQALVEKIKKVGGESVYTVTDVTSLDQVKTLATQALNAFGRIDVWMNNAGLMPPSEFINGKVNEWNQMIDVNIKGVLNGINASLETFRNQGEGHYINISSTAGHFSHAGNGVYSATKHAVLAISESLREEEAIAQSGVRVTVISPGAVATELPNKISDDKLRKNINDFYDAVAIDADRVAEAIQFAIDAPVDTTMNEIIIRPTKQVV